jgi:hypothetical protein
MVTFSFVGSPGTASIANGGKVYAAVVGTSGAQVVAGNPTRQSIIFQNPGSGRVNIYPTVNATGGVNAPSNASPQGSFQILPGASMTITGECQVAWGAFAAGANSPLTILESNV